MVGDIHGVVKEVEYLDKPFFICSQHFRDGKNYMLDLIFLKAELYFTHLGKSQFKNTSGNILENIIEIYNI